MDLKKYGFMPHMMPEDISGIPARVTAVHRERYELVCEYGEIYGRLKTKEYFVDCQTFPTTGDFVVINFNPVGDSLILFTIPRKSFFSRRDPSPGRGEQAVASNFDYVFIMQSLNQDFNTKRMERYLTLGWQSGAIPIVVLTKADLSDDIDKYIHTVQKIATGVPVHAVSSKSGLGIADLSCYMITGKTIVLLGSSGVGKSSLLNALAGEEIMAVNSIREDDSKGRHTTTHRQLIMLKNGVMVIDTPGLRELGMWDVSIGLDEAFSDVEQFLGKCKFTDCRHDVEPGCAIRSAILKGELSIERWESYLNLKNEAIFADDKGAFLRQKQQRNKKIAKMNKQIKAVDRKLRGEKK